MFFCNLRFFWVFFYLHPLLCCFLIAQAFFEVQSHVIGELFVGLPACFLFIVLFLMQVYTNSFERQVFCEDFFSCCLPMLYLAASKERQLKQTFGSTRAEALKRTQRHLNQLNPGVLRRGGGQQAFGGEAIIKRSACKFYSFSH